MDTKFLIYEALRTIATAFICSMGLFSVYYLEESFPILYSVLGVLIIYFPTIIYGIDEDGDSYIEFTDDDDESFAEALEREEKEEQERENRK